MVYFVIFMLIFIVFFRPALHIHITTLLAVMINRGFGCVAGVRPFILRK